MSELEDMKARAEKATPGPWMAFKGTNADGIDCAESGLTWDDHNGEVFKPEDADFIAHARTDVPKLIAALEAVEDLLLTLDTIEAGQPSGYKEWNLCAGGTASVIRKVITEALA